MDSYAAIKFIYQSYVDSEPYITTDMDIHRRHPRYCRELLAKLNLDRSIPPSVLITGSKGKGSTSAILASLVQQGYNRVGLFTGPHLVDFCERIRINGIKIDEESFIRLTRQTMAPVEEILASLPRHHYIGPVGITLAVAMLWYREQGVSFSVVECGRGGLSDDVSVLANRWSVLTPVMMEHVRELGPTLLDIAANKAGIVRPGVEICVSCRQAPEVVLMIKSLCRHMGVPLKLEGEDYHVEFLRGDLMGNRFRYRSEKRDCSFTIPLPGMFQVYNAGAAIAVAEEIMPDICDAKLQAGLASVNWPGRCELVPGQPPVLLDGAINAQSAEYLARLLPELEEPLSIVVGVPADKDWQGVLAVLAPRARELVLTTAANPHLNFPGEVELMETARSLNASSLYIPDSRQAILHSMAAVREKGSVVVAGTQSLIRDAKIVLTGDYQRGDGYDQKAVP